MQKTWVVAPRTEEDIVTQLMVNRGIPKDERASFLAPTWTSVHSPFLFTQMPHAVARMFAALTGGTPIVIHGDYDADGVSGASLLYGALMEIAERLQLAADVDVYLPDREKDGYGVAMHTVERIASEGAKLLVTVDCGIANADQLDRAHELGVDAIVCDHHQLGERLPAHAILLHPLAPGETYPNKTLCGTGVAFKFAAALVHEARQRGADFPDGHEKWYLDLVAIATVTDVMPLRGENRVLEHFGLKVLRKTRRPGLQAIVASAGSALDDIDTEVIGFRIGPRLNAAGRLASAEFAYRALVAPNIVEGMKAAAQLEALNRRRQDVFTKAYEEAKRMVGDATPPVLVVWSDAWLPGIVGLIAGRLASDMGIPAFAFARVGEHYVGSGRTAGGLHLVEAMQRCGDIFVKRGGHPQACGLTIANAELLATFRDRVCDVAREHFNSAPPPSELAIDAELPFAACTWELYEALAQCAPFGEGNRPPVFAAFGLEVVGAETMGAKKNHLRVTVYDDGQMVQCIGFGLGEWAAKLGLGARVNIAYALEANVWNGTRRLQYRILDLVAV